MFLLLPLLIFADVSPQHSGTLDVESLGQIALPPGNWHLQRQHVSAVADKTPDVFLFHKAAPSTERLTILRYGPQIAPEHPVYLCDSVGDSSLFGIPHFLDPNATQRSADGEVEMLRKPADWYAARIAVTYVYPDADATMWMSNAVLFSQEQSTFVCIHCAASVLAPAVLDDVVAGSVFHSDAPQKTKAVGTVR